ncbi:ArnT family glycosyltransferase [Prevotella koreensis]
MTKKILIFGLLTLLIGIAGLHTGIFWDNTTFVSAMGNALYENGIFAWGSIPTATDPGHPPFIATLMAASWSIFGRSLMVSHLVLLPFVFGILWQVWDLCSYYFNRRSDTIAAFLFVIADATLLSQMTLVTTEVPLMFFFLLTLNGMLRDCMWKKSLGLAFLGIVSLRGMMLCGGLFLVDLFLHRGFIKWKSYVIGSLPALIFIVWRLIFKGWIISNPESTWGDATGYGSLIGFFKNFSWNIAVVVQRFIDFGRIVPLLFIVITLLLRRGWKNIQYRNILVVAIGSTSVVWGISLFIVNPIGHRYFTVSYLLLALLAVMMLREYVRRKAIYFFMLLALIAGNFIVYPDKMAQGWDSSLAQLNYWDVRRDMIDYIDDRKIDVKNVATFFPNNGEIDGVDLNNDHRQWADFTGKEQYVFYSNVFNLSDEEIELIKRDYRMMKQFSKMGVRTELYKKRQYTVFSQKNK